MRSLLLVILIFGSLPAMLIRPYFGVLTWTWISLMNPHRLTSGLANTLRLAAVVAVASLTAWIVSREPKRPFMSFPVVAFLVLSAWLTLCQFYAVAPDLAWEKWYLVSKVFLMTYVTMAIVRGRERIEQLVWVIVLSLGYYGVAGGIFTVLHGGSYRVWGPPDSFIQDNNALALALTMTVPLMRYLSLETKKRWLRWGLWGAMGLSVLSVLGTWSRGGFIALGITLAALWWKTQHKLATIVLFAPLLATALAFAPAEWWDRMHSIESYEQDRSAQARLRTWRFAWHLALDRPIMGGGFKVFYDRNTTRIYEPDLDEDEDTFNAHSIYFELLGETGFVGLGLFISLGVGAFVMANRAIRLVQSREDLRWAGLLARTLQVSVIAYATAGAFLNLGFFDLYYTLLAVLVAVHGTVRRAVAPEAGGALIRTAPRITRPIPAPNQRTA